MFNKFPSKFIFVLFLIVSGFAATNPAHGSPIIINEKFAVKALQTIHSAQATSISVNLRYTTLQQLGDLGFIDPVLATSEKYGYYFSVTLVTYPPTQATGFQVSAVPQRYGRSGRRSFYLDESGVIRGADRNGEPATADDSPVPINCGEIGAINMLRTFNGAEATYYSSTSNYGTLTQLIKESLINPSLANGDNCGYLYRVSVTPRKGNVPAQYQVRATPQQYGVSGVRSFYIDETGVVRGADKGGAEANADDPPTE